MNKKTYTTEESILERADEVSGDKFSLYDINSRLQSKGNKGALGHIVEEGVYGYEINSDQSTDFLELGIELKVTPYVWNKNRSKISSKERLVLTMINYVNDFNLSFYDSHCYSKLNKILIFFYQHADNTLISDFVISHNMLYDFKKISKNDQLIIIDDYYVIIDKIKKGNAHLISESDTNYLSACTKAANSTIMVKQPFSDIKAKPRAFSLKPKYMTSLLRSNVGEINRESLLEKSKHPLSIESTINNLFSPYISKSLSEIDMTSSTKVNREAKNYLRNYIQKMLNVATKNLEDLDEFFKAGIKIKTIRVKKNGSIKESMSFPAFSFVDIVNEKWETSTLRTYFLDHKFLFVIFDEIEDCDKEYRFRGWKLWGMPDNDIDGSLKAVWSETVSVITEGIQTSTKGNRVYNNFPGSKDNSVAHVRPHARNKLDVSPLPSGGSFTKQSFWLNQKYIQRIVND